MAQQEWLARQFEDHRPHLRAVAYRMLGSLSEADDAVQDSWLRFSRADTSEVENLRAWLTTIVAHVALNTLRSRRSHPTPLRGLSGNDELLHQSSGDTKFSRRDHDFDRLRTAEFVALHGEGDTEACRLTGTARQSSQGPLRNESKAESSGGLDLAGQGVMIALRRGYELAYTEAIAAPTLDRPARGRLGGTCSFTAAGGGASLVGKKHELREARWTRKLSRNLLPLSRAQPP